MKIFGFSIWLVVVPYILPQTSFFFCFTRLKFFFMRL